MVGRIELAVIIWAYLVKKLKWGMVNECEDLIVEEYKKLEHCLTLDLTMSSLIICFESPKEHLWDLNSPTTS